MKAYSIDLRQRIVLAVERGEDSQAEVAAQYDVSLSSVERFVRQWRTTESVAPSHGPRGPKRKLASYGDWLRAEVQRQPDATLAELCERLAKAHGVQAHPSLLWRELQILELPLKKVPARQRA
jgi:putative transposase